VHSRHENTDERCGNELGDLDERVHGVDGHRRGISGKSRRGGFTETGEFDRPPEAGPDQHRTQRHAASGRPDRVPRPRGDLCRIDRFVHLKDAAQVRELEHLGHFASRASQPQRAVNPSCARVGAHQGPNAGAVDHLDARQIDDQVAVSVANQSLQLLLECFGGTTADERLSRREDHPGTTETGSWHWACVWYRGSG
jgi:hypothetical protein